MRPCQGRPILQELVQSRIALHEQLPGVVRNASSRIFFVEMLGRKALGRDAKINLEDLFAHGRVVGQHPHKQDGHHDSPLGKVVGEDISGMHEYLGAFGQSAH